MTKQEIKLLIAENAKDIFYGDCDKLADAIIARQDERLKEFVEWWLKNLDENLRFWEERKNDFSYSGFATQCIYEIRNEKARLTDYYQKFLEETSDDSK